MLLLIALTHYCTSLPDFGWLRHVGEGFFSPFFQSSFAVCRFVDHKSSVKFDRKRMVRPLLKSAFPYTCRPDFAAKNAIVFSNSKWFENICWQFWHVSGKFWFEWWWSNAPHLLDVETKIYVMELGKKEEIWLISFMIEKECGAGDKQLDGCNAYIL